MARTFIDRQTGRVFEVGQDRPRMFIGGDQMIVGNDRMMLGNDPVTAQQVAAARDAGGFMVQDKVPSPVAFYQMLPFSMDVLGLAPFRFPLFPQRCFRVDNLVITSPEGPFFEINQWTVGQENMFVADGSVNGAAFSEAAAQRALGMRGFTANQGATIIIGGVNTSVDQHRVSGLFAGPSTIAVG